MSMIMKRAHLISNTKMHIEDMLLKAKYISKKKVKGKWVYKYKEGEKKENGSKQKELNILDASARNLGVNIRDKEHRKFLQPYIDKGYLKENKHGVALLTEKGFTFLKQENKDKTKKKKTHTGIDRFDSYQDYIKRIK